MDGLVILAMQFSVNYIIHMSFAFTDQSFRNFYLRFSYSVYWS